MSVNVSPDQKVQRFFEQYTMRSFRRREILIQAGDDPQAIFYLASGRVSQYDVMPNGAEVVVNIYKPGAFFPMSWAINKTPNQYFFEAATDITVSRAPADKVLDFLKANPDVLYDLLARLYRGTDGVLRRMLYLMGGDAKSRVIFELMNNLHRFGEARRDGSICVPVSESGLAKQSGLSRETVNRTLSEVGRDGLVRAHRGNIIVSDYTALERLLSPTSDR